MELTQRADDDDLPHRMSVGKEVSSGSARTGHDRICTGFRAGGGRNDERPGAVGWPDLERDFLQGHVCFGYVPVLVANGFCDNASRPKASHRRFERTEPRLTSAAHFLYRGQR